MQLWRKRFPFPLTAFGVLILVASHVYSCSFQVARSQEDFYDEDYDPHGSGHTHKGAVGKFYQTWNRPEDRTKNCCGVADCRPILAIHKLGNGSFDIEVNDYGVVKRFRVPDDIWEDSQSDPRESPDERSHACIEKGKVICAVRAGGQ